MTLFCLSQAAAYAPFRDPLWGGWNYWALFLIPLCVGIAIVYKGIRVDDIMALPGVAAVLALEVIGSLLGLALLLWAVLRVMEW